jgi:hypothetical protein
MASGAELSSVATALDELTKRVADLAEGLAGSDQDDLATTLYEVERSLATAARRLGRVVDVMR